MNLELPLGQSVATRTGGPFTSLTQDLDCEVVIVGGGLTGMVIAYELGKAGFNCVLIDRGMPGKGSTAASTALVSYELDTPLCELIRQVGEREAVASYLACRKAIGTIESLVSELGGECDFKRRKSVYLAERSEHVPGLKEELETRNKHGIPVEFLDSSAIESLFSFSRPGALLTHEAAELDVGKFFDALVHAVVANGVRIFSRTGLESYDTSQGGVTLQSDRGYNITARKIVFATGYQSEKYLPGKVGTLKKTFTIATRPITEFRGWYERCLIWTSERPYLYLRTTADNRAIIGGEDILLEKEPSSRELLGRKAARLEASFRSLFPDIKCEVDRATSAVFGESNDSLPYIGQPPGMENTYFALAYGGNGLVYAILAAEIIRDACYGKRNSLAHLFRFDR